MIASLSGTVSRLRLDAAVIEVAGIGILVHATPRTLATLELGGRAQLATSLVVREDSLTLFGFSDDDERATFETLQTVSGIGPRLALAMLAVHDPQALRRAVATDDLTALRKVPGVGLKGAQRLALELKGKLGAPTDAGTSTSEVALEDDGWRGRVLQALVGLGWATKAADDALDKVAPAPGEPVDVPGVLRAALQRLGRA
jgi:Holliday junction DNA helicase RuvA